MPQLDRLFESMAKRGASQAILLSDQPIQLFIGTQIIEGTPLSGTALQSMLAEVMPPERSAELLQDGQFEVYHDTPQGIMHLNVTRRGKILKVVASPAPISATAPIVQQTPQTPSIYPPPTSTSYEGAPQSAPTMPYQGGVPVPPPPPPSAGTYGPGYGLPNSSGAGAMAEVPPEILGRWNWGAFLCSWIWGIGNNTWLALLWFVPCVGWIMSFVLGAKGNEWAWRNKRFESVEQFKKTQATWGWVGLGLNCIVLPILLLLFIIPLAITGPVFARARSNAQRSSSQSNLKQIGLGVLQFSQDHNDTLPAGRTLTQWKSATLPYTKSDNLYVSPSTSQPYSVNPSLGGIALTSITNPASTPMMYESKADVQNGHNILFTDGHVKWISGSNWPTYRTYLDSVGAE